MGVGVGVAVAADELASAANAAEGVAEGVETQLPVRPHHLYPYRFSKNA